jgi:hypothetical protein
MVGYGSLSVLVCESAQDLGSAAPAPGIQVENTRRRRLLAARSLAEVRRTSSFLVWLSPAQGSTNGRIVPSSTEESNE